MLGETIDVPRPLFQLDFAISFAEEDAECAKKLADSLAEIGARVFEYTEWQHKLVGKNLPEAFRNIFTKQTRFFVPLISHSYVSKDWPVFEYFEALKEKAARKHDYFLPVRIDDAQLPGTPFIGHIDLRQTSFQAAAEILMLKLKEQYSGRARNIFPAIWAATFGVGVEPLMTEEVFPANITPDYPSLCDWLEEDLDARLNKSPLTSFDYTEESARDGEGLSVRIAFLSGKEPGPISFGDLE